MTRLFLYFCFYISVVIFLCSFSLLADKKKNNNNNNNNNNKDDNNNIIVISRCKRKQIYIYNYI